MTISPYHLLFLIPIIPLSFLLLLHHFVRRRSSRIPIKNLHVFITRGSSGIDLAHQVVAARVSILARSRNRLDEARDSIRLATDVKADVFSAFVRNTGAVDEAGPIDVLIFNQGVFTSLELEKQDLEEIKFMMDVNLMGAFIS